MRPWLSSIWCCECAEAADGLCGWTYGYAAYWVPRVRSGGTLEYPVPGNHWPRMGGEQFPANKIIFLDGFAGIPPSYTQYINSYGPGDDDAHRGRTVLLFSGGNVQLLEPDHFYDPTQSWFRDDLASFPH